MFKEFKPHPNKGLNKLRQDRNKLIEVQENIDITNGWKN